MHRYRRMVLQEYKITDIAEVYCFRCSAPPALRNSESCEARNAWFSEHNFTQERDDNDPGTNTIWTISPDVRSTYTNMERYCSTSKRASATAESGLPPACGDHRGVAAAV